MSPTTMNRISRHHVEPSLGVFAKSKNGGPSEINAKHTSIRGTRFQLDDRYDFIEYKRTEPSKTCISVFDSIDE